MKRLLPTPMLSVTLFVLWLLLTQSLSAGHLFLALVLSVAVPLLTAGLRPLPVRIRRPGTIARLVLTVAADSLQSNAAVIRLLLSPGPRRHPSDFVHVPLKVRDPNALAVLATIVCITPGTAWAELSLDRSMLLLHVLEVDDEAAIVAHVQRAYERPLMEIFES